MPGKKPILMEEVGANSVEKCLLDRAKWCCVPEIDCPLGTYIGEWEVPM